MCMKRFKASELLTSNDKKRSDEDAIKKLAKLVQQMSLDFAEVSEWGRRIGVVQCMGCACFIIIEGFAVQPHQHGVIIVVRTAAHFLAASVFPCTCTQPGGHGTRSDEDRSKEGRRGKSPHTKQCTPIQTRTCPHRFTRCTHLLVRRSLVMCRTCKNVLRDSQCVIFLGGK